MSSGMTPIDVMVNRILVVEDNRDEAEFLKTLLIAKRFTVEIAKDSGQAHVAFTMHLPDFVLMDVILPNEVSGFEVCERMKKDNPHVPVMMLTAIDMDDARSLAARVGADAYLTKPYDPAELLAQIPIVAEEVWKRRHLGPSVAIDSDKVRFNCPECGKKLKVKASHRGRTLNCPRCGQHVVVPVFD